MSAWNWIARGSAGPLLALWQAFASSAVRRRILQIEHGCEYPQHQFVQATGLSRSPYWPFAFVNLSAEGSRHRVGPCALCTEGFLRMTLVDQLVFCRSIALLLCLQVSQCVRSVCCTVARADCIECRRQQDRPSMRWSDSKPIAQISKNSLAARPTWIIALAAEEVQ